MSARAGIVVTGTEVLTGRVVDRNGPWLADRLLRARRRARPQRDRRRPARRRRGGAGLAGARTGVDLIVTSGGLGPDRGRPDRGGRRALPGARDGARRGAGGADRGDPARRLQRAGPTSTWTPSATRTASRRSCPRARRCSSRSARRRGSSCRLSSGAGPDRSSCCPARRASCSRCGGRPSRRTRSARRSRGAVEYSSPRCCGCSASPSRRSPRRCGARARTGIDLDALEITTCLRRGEVEVVTRYEPGAGGGLRRPSRSSCARATRDTLFSDDGTSVDQQVAALLRERGWHDRDGGVVHRRAAGGAAHRPRGRVRVLPGRRRRLRPTRRRTQLGGVDRRRSIARTARCRSRSPRALADGARARAGRRRRGRRHRHRRAGRRDAGEAGRARVLLGGAAPDGAIDALARRCRADALRRARPLDDGRACTWSGACCSARDATRACGCSSRWTCRRTYGAGAGAMGSRARSATTTRLRLVREESLHVTLVFLGERDDPSAIAAAARGSRWRRRCPRRPLHLGGVLWLAAAAAARPDGRAGRPHRRASPRSRRRSRRRSRAMRAWSRGRPLPAARDGRARARGRDAAVRGWRRPPAVEFRPGAALTLYRSRARRRRSGPATSRCRPCRCPHSCDDRRVVPSRRGDGSIRSDP